MMDKFCGDSFANATSVADDQHWWLCVLDMSSSCVPIGVFCLAVPCHLAWAHNYPSRQQQHLTASRLNIAKLVIGCILSMLTLFRLAQHISQDQHAVVVITDVALLFTTISATALTQHEHRMSIITSAPLFVFWLTKAGCDVILSSIAIFSQEYGKGTVVSSAFLAVLSMAMMSLYAFADPIAVSNYRNYHCLDERACPEMTVSFLNDMTFTWIRKLLMKSYKHGLEVKAMWDLNLRDQSGKLMSLFETNWTNEANRIRTNVTKSKVTYRRSRRSKSSVEFDTTSEYIPLMQYKKARAKNGWRCKMFPWKYDSCNVHVSDNSAADTADNSYSESESGSIKAEMKRQTTSLARVLLRQFRVPMLQCLALKLVYDFCIIASIFIMGQLLTQLSQKGVQFESFMLTVVLFVMNIGRTVVHSRGIYKSFYTGLQTKSVLVCAIYNKCLRFSNNAKKTMSSGEIISLVTVDAQRLHEFGTRFYFGVTVPFVVLFQSGVLVYYAGNVAFAGIAVFVLITMFTCVLCLFINVIEQRFMRENDRRVNVFNEIINGIKVLKLYAWEESFEQRLAHFRGKEIKYMVWRAIVSIIAGVNFEIVTFLSIFAMYGGYVFSNPGQAIDVSVLFVVMGTLTILRLMLGSFSTTVLFFVQAKVSLHRINNFLNSEELDPNAVTRDSDSGDAIRVDNGTFTWEEAATPALQNISVRVARGKLVAVVGAVGAGKSSFINCILGEMTKLTGKVAVKGCVSYVPQQAWIRNCSLRDNVLLGQTFQADRYHHVLRACQLQHDLDILPAGDLTEIGEKGVNLSGGQKQRVNLARAVYRDSDVYLLDDPLAAVDSHVGKAIFKEVIGPQGILKGKTRLLVTHGVHWLPMVDEIVVMNQGEITEVGSYSQLLQHNRDFASFLRTFLTQHQPDRHVDDLDEDEDTDPEISELRRRVLTDVETMTSDGGMTGDEETSRFHKIELLPRTRHLRKKRPRPQKKRVADVTFYDQNDDDKTDKSASELGKLITAETFAEGQKRVRCFLHYWKCAGWGTMAFGLLALIAARVMAVITNFWLQGWSDDPVIANRSLTGSEIYSDRNIYYIVGYGLLGASQQVLIILFNLAYWTSCMKASRRLHDSMTHCLFRAPMSFFDSTPIGRIMNRMSADMDTVDTMLPYFVRDLLGTLMAIGSTISVFVVVRYTSILVLLPAAVVVYFGLASGLRLCCWCKKLEAVSRSPLLAHLGETLNGRTTIRAHQATERFMAECKTRVDVMQNCNSTYMVSLCWLQQVLDLLLGVILFAVLSLELLSSDPSPGAVGLIIIYSTQLSYYCVYTIRLSTEVDNTLISVDRIKEYAEVSSEAAWSTHQDLEGWPSFGQVELRDYSVRYRPNLDLALKGISCCIKSGEKIGIVGRTGAGKSSLMLALFRLIEGQNGAILIDDVNIADLGLHDLRSRLTILPQDPVLFSGTVRFNLDPFGEHEDQALWGVLQQAHLKQFVLSLPGQLDFECEEDGSNFSVGQRQLVCLARTLLRRTRLLVLDEATAAVDMETDALIQTTVKEAFSTCTVLTIAHRLHTIIDYDRILVMDAGQIREFDTPQSLMESPGSAFAAMLQHAQLNN